MSDEIKALSFSHAEFGSCLSRQDGSVKFSVITPELRPSEGGALLRLHGKAIRVLIEPIVQGEVETIEVTTERDTKSPSQRLRAILFVLYKSNAEYQKTPFDIWYAQKLDKLCEHFKAMIPEEGGR